MCNIVLDLIQTWIGNHTPSKVCDKITYLVPNFKRCTVGVREWKGNFIAHIIINVSTYHCWDETMLVKGPLVSALAWVSYKTTLMRALTLWDAYEITNSLQTIWKAFWCLHFGYNAIHLNVLMWYNWRQSSFCSCTDVAPIMRQAIIWTNEDQGMDAYICTARRHIKDASLLGTKNRHASVVCTDATRRFYDNQRYHKWWKLQKHIDFQISMRYKILILIFLLTPNTRKCMGA